MAGKFNPSLPRTGQRTKRYLTVWPWQPDGKGPAPIHAAMDSECPVCDGPIRRAKNKQSSGTKIRKYTEGQLFRGYVHWPVCWNRLYTKGAELVLGAKLPAASPVPPPVFEKRPAKALPAGVVSPDEERARGKEVIMQQWSDLPPWQR